MYVSVLGGGWLQPQRARRGGGDGAGRRPRREYLAPRPRPNVSRSYAPPRRPAAPDGGWGWREGGFPCGAATTPSGTRSRRGCGPSGRSSASGAAARKTSIRRARRGWFSDGLCRSGMHGTRATRGRARGHCTGLSTLRRRGSGGARVGGPVGLRLPISIARHCQSASPPPDTTSPLRPAGAGWRVTPRLSLRVRPTPVTSGPPAPAGCRARHGRGPTKERVSDVGAKVAISAADGWEGREVSLREAGVGPGIHKVHQAACSSGVQPICLNQCWRDCACKLKL